MGDSPSATAKWSKHSVEDGKLTRKQEFCPECGPGVFLAVHGRSEALWPLWLLCKERVITRNQPFFPREHSAH